MKSTHQTIAGVNVVTLSRPDVPKSVHKTLVFIHEQTNGFLSAILTSTVNPKLKNSETVNRHALAGFQELLSIHSPPKAAHLWAEEFYDEYVMFRHLNPLISATIVQVDLLNNMTHFYRIAESETWVKQNNVWVDVFPENMLTSKGEKILSDITKHHADDMWGERMEQLDDLALWRYPLMGLTESPVLGYKRIPFNELQTIVLSFSDVKLHDDMVDTINLAASKKTLLPDEVNTAIIIGDTPA